MSMAKVETLTAEQFKKQEAGLEKLVMDKYPFLRSSDFALFMHIVDKTGLDPLVGQIIPVPRGDKITFQTSIDGLRVLAERNGRYSPGKEPEYLENEKGIVYATATVRKMTTDGTWHDVSARAYWDEYAQRNKDGTPANFWKRMPHLMLAKCAESLALRKAFPADLSGIFSNEEMDQAENPKVTEQEKSALDSQIEELTKKLAEVKPKPFMDEKKHEELEFYLSRLPEGTIEVLLKKCNLTKLDDLNEKLFKTSIEWLNKKLGEI